MRKFDFVEIAVKSLYPTVESLAYDKVTDEVIETVPPHEVDHELVRTEVVRLEAMYNGYQRQRAAAYPSITDQLDTLYHGGYDAWKASIAAVKQQFPKPE